MAVRVALHATSRSKAKAQAAGLTVTSGSDAAEWADVVMIRCRHDPDCTQGGWAEDTTPVGTPQR